MMKLGIRVADIEQDRRLSLDEANGDSALYFILDSIVPGLRSRLRHIPRPTLLPRIVDNPAS